MVGEAAETADGDLLHAAVRHADVTLALVDLRGPAAGHQRGCRGVGAHNRYVNLGRQLIGRSVTVLFGEAVITLGGVSADIAITGEEILRVGFVGKLAQEERNAFICEGIGSGAGCSWIKTGPVKLVAALRVSRPDKR